MKIFTSIITLALTLLCFTGVQAQSTNVQFLVNMNHQIDLGNFDPATQTVDIAGTFNAWGSPTTVLSDSNGDGIYTATVSLTIGTTIQFKTRIDAQWNGTEEFPGAGPNRSYTVVANGVVEYWYNDEVSPDALNASIGVSSTVIQPGEAVQFFDQSSGNPVSWTWSFPGGSPAFASGPNPVVTYAAVGTYSVTLTITNANGDMLTKNFPNFIRVDPMNTFWWNDRVFYEIFVRSFKDSNGDGKGDIQGLISKLDYLNDGDPNTTTDLGITGIWLMPIQQSPSYHGYDVTNYEVVEQDYGTNADFLQLMEAAHARGIKVIIDMVMNHTSNQHPWFVASMNPASDKRDWYIWEDTNPGTPGPFENNAWHSSGGDFYYGAFGSGMPDLNFYNEEVQDEFEDIATYWLQEMGVDGFRLDAVKYLYENGTMVQDTPETIAYWHEFRDFYKSVNPEAFAVGEAWDLTPIASQYVNNEGLDYAFEFELADAMINGINSGNADDLRDQMAEVMISYPFLQFGTILSNHDSNRVMSQLGTNVAKAKVVAGLLLTLPGIPYIYYGEELGATGIKPDENLRRPMQWTTSSTGFTSGTPWTAPMGGIGVELQQADPASMWQHYRSLIALRQQEPALTKGTYKEVDSDSPEIFSFIRQFGNENVVVVANFSTATLNDITFSLSNGGIAPGTYDANPIFGGNAAEVTIGGDGGFQELDLGTIAPRTITVYKFTSALGTPEYNSTQLALYPNPANDSFELNIPAKSVDIYTLTGQLVKSFVSNDAGFLYDISGLSGGMYLVKITDENNHASTKKLVKE